MVKQEFKVKIYRLIFYTCLFGYGIYLCLLELFELFHGLLNGGGGTIKIVIIIIVIILLLMFFFNSIFKRIRVVCTSDEFIVYKGNLLYARAQYNDTRFTYKIERYKAVYHCYLNYIDVEGEERYTDCSSLGLNQFQEICKLLNMYGALDLGNSTSDLENFPVVDNEL